MKSLNLKNRYKIAIGVPSYNEAGRIGFVVSQVDKGLQKYFDPSECLILNLDSDSKDGTKEVFLKTKTICRKKYVVTPPGKGNAMLQFFKFCIDNNISYLATIDADLKSITSRWPFLLVGPIMNG